MQNSNSNAGTTADSSSKPKLKRQAKLLPNPMLAEVRSITYYLCSAEVVKHFPDLERSKPFKSGYEHDTEDVYFIIGTYEYEKLFDYYERVIAPFNEKSNVDDIDYWLRECTDSQIDEAPKGCITKCRAYGIFRAIEAVWNLTNEKNRAFAIHKMSEYYGLTSIEFVNRVVK